MKRLRPKFKSNKTIALAIVIVCGPLIALLLHFATNFLIDRYTTTQFEADATCNQLLQDVKSQVTAVRSFTVVGERKSCSGSKDEAGSTDYYLTIVLRVAKDPPITSQSMKSNIKSLAAKLPNKNYDVRVENNPSVDGQPETICVSASAYLDNDGKFYPQGFDGVHATYIEQNEFKGGYSSGCADLK